MAVEPIRYSKKDGLTNEGFEKDVLDTQPNGLSKATEDINRNGIHKNGDLQIADIEDSENRDHACGWGRFTPFCCQKCRNINIVLFCISIFSLTQGMVVNGFVNVVISNIERRFSISSTESGTIASCYDIASVLLLIPVTYFGGQGVKPRYLGLGVLVLGLGSFVFTIPHFATDTYIVDGAYEDTCNGFTNSTCAAGESLSSLSDFKYLFFLGQLLHGAGAAPLYTLGVTYLDENLPQRSSSFYVGIFYTFAILGPALGYLVGGELLNIYTDFRTVDTDSLTIDKDNPRWVGAWWLGFLISGTMAFLTAIPLGGFPRSLPGSAKYRAERKNEVYHKEGSDDSQKVGLKRGPKDILLSIKLLVTNPTFMFLNFAASSEGILLSGFSTFAPKFLEAQFSFSSGWAAQIMGLALLPAGGGGTLIGGFLVKRFNWKVRTIVKFCLCTTAFSMLPSFILFMHCENVAFSGVNIKYDANVSHSDLKFLGGNLNGDCNEACKCTNDNYNPVCGVDGKMYFSPCYAGCAVGLGGDPKKYTNCSCISNTTNTANSPYMAISGKCESDCQWLPLFAPLFALVMFMTFLTTMPALSATLRCVPENQRSFSLGIQWIIARCLGSIPGPILFGKMIDLTCVVWQNKCGDQGSCFFYNNQQLSYNLLALGMVLKILSTLFFFLSLKLYKPPPFEEIQISPDTTSESLSSNGKLSNGKVDADDTPAEDVAQR